MYDESGPSSRRAAERNFSPVSENDVFYNGETESGASCIPRAVFVNAVEAFEDVCLILERYASAVVGDGYFQPPGI